MFRLVASELFSIILPVLRVWKEAIQSALIIVFTKNREVRDALMSLRVMRFTYAILIQSRCDCFSNYVCIFCYVAAAPPDDFLFSRRRRLMKDGAPPPPSRKHPHPVWAHA